MEQIKVIAERNDWLVVDKPSGLPTVPLKSDRPEKDTLLSRLGEAYPEVLSVGRNPWEGGVLHRLDTPTSGLVLVARTQRAFDDLWEEQRHDEIVKTYLAVSSKRLSPLPVGFVPFPFGDITLGRTVIRSLFRPFGEKGRVVRPVAEDSPSALRGKSTGIWYETEVEFLGKDGTTCRFSCVITQGFRHQIRCHMAWAGYPLDGDVTYRGLPEKPFGLTAQELQFIDPETGKRVRCVRPEA
jgi:23S rRNA pseudouridine1911/1915/1917 synthase